MNGSSWIEFLNFLLWVFLTTALSIINLLIFDNIFIMGIISFMVGFFSDRLVSKFLNWVYKKGPVKEGIRYD